ncbi:MAG: hypothetical protein ABII12_03120 [Planctomycetota bacterium]
MAAIPTLLYFRGQVLGDGIVKMEPDNLAATPPVAQVGLFQESAGLNGDSINMQYGLVVTIHLARYSPIEFARDITAIQRLQGLQGNLEIKVDGSVQCRGLDWFLMFAPRPAILDGFGGRFVQEWPLRFAGDSGLQFFS